MEMHSAKSKRLLNFSSKSYVFWTAFLVTVIALWMSLQPVLKYGNITLYNPSFIIISLTSSWRVFGRLYSIVAIGLVVMAGISLDKLSLTYPARSKQIIGLCLVAIILEFSIFPLKAHTKTFNYNDTPPVYSWLKDNKRIRAVAEYPLDELPHGIYLSDYYTFQQVSKKPILNSILPNSPNASLRKSIAGISDPQTIPVLRALGIDVVNIRPNDLATRSASDTSPSASSNINLEQIFTHKSSSGNINSYKVKPGVRANYALTLPNLQYFQIFHRKDGGVNYMVDNDTLLKVVALPGGKTKDKITVGFTISTDSLRKATIVQNGELIWSGLLTNEPVNLKLDISPVHDITIINQRNAKPTNTVISNLQVID